MADHLGPGGTLGLTVHQDASGHGAVLAGQGLDQLALAVAGDARHPDDLHHVNLVEDAFEAFSAAGDLDQAVHVES